MCKATRINYYIIIHLLPHTRDSYKGKSGKWNRSGFYIVTQLGKSGKKIAYMRVCIITVHGSLIDTVDRIVKITIRQTGLRHSIAESFSLGVRSGYRFRTNSKYKIWTMITSKWMKW